MCLLVHLRKHSAGCLFSITVYAARGMPASMEGFRLAVSMRIARRHRSNRPPLSLRQDMSKGSSRACVMIRPLFLRFATPSLATGRSLLAACWLILLNSAFKVFDVMCL